MAEINILKTDSRGRITLPHPFRSESLFEYIVDEGQIILYPVRTVRKFPDMSGLPEKLLDPEWENRELNVNQDKRPSISAASPFEALKQMMK
jgi:hypothetical protein